MFEVLKIKYLNLQPISKITYKTLERIILREYCNNFEEVRQKLKLIHSDTSKGKIRLSAAVLKLSNGDMTNLDFYIKRCNNDFRDVISKAEYPRALQFGFNNNPVNQSKIIYLDDWTEYTNWLNK